MTVKKLKEIGLHTLEEMKANDIVVLDVRKITDITDYMIIASGSSSRHVKSIATRVVDEYEKLNEQAVGVEGIAEGRWALVDMGDVIIHIMTPTEREFYQLEKLWSSETRSDSSIG